LKALSTVRRRIDELTMHGATAPNATIGQLLYAARRRANLTIAETAQAAGVAEESVIAAESGKFIPLPELGRLAALVDQLDWR
jgi:DNA-binding XRE family transcriptional regulator